ncbi:hypothetical protein [Saccharothrix xinjiangensis]|uniref:Tryptophan 2,3-dioxygenase n=1 Tax=Saccharothrix xinjiangensis TaxID=204798 RepID=A0ABV9YFV4_9PSEU
MITPEALRAERALVEVGRTGPGGAGLRACRTQDSGRSGETARRAMSRWHERGATAEAFPYAETVAHFRVTGRAAADGALVALLRASYDSLPVKPSLLRAWLPSTFDQDDGDYHSYVCTGVLAWVVGRAAPDGRRRVLDELVVATAADLLRIEAEALAATPDRAHEVRTRAAVRVLAACGVMMPALMSEQMAASASAKAVDERSGSIQRTARSLAGTVLDRVPGPLREAVEVTLLPMTRLHDEQMFIRCIQIFEGVYEQVVTSLRRARVALVSGDAESARDELDSATARVRTTPAVFRVLTTMPVDVFAVIRGYTAGRSAVQSTAYRAVERLAASSARVGAAGAPASDGDEPSLQEAYLALDRPSGVAHSMACLDDAWNRMKRTHWGLTLKIIGRVPGTGGTSGADYLRQALDQPLFPWLVNRGGEPWRT